MTKIKIGQIGVGHPHAGGKMSALRGSSDFEVVGVVEPNKKLRETVGKHSLYKDVPWLTLEQLLNRKDVQAIAVETEVPQLLTTAEACINAGKHIHLDKPAGLSLPHFKKILDIAAKKHLLVQMGYMYRYNPGVLLMRDLLKQNALGDLFEVHTTMSKLMSAASRKTLEQLPGGMMLELACHVIDLVVIALGRPQKVHPFGQHASSIDDQLLDNMLAVLTYPKAIATVKTSCNEVNGFARRHITLCGSGGTLHIQPFNKPAAYLTLLKATDKFKKGSQEIKLPKYKRYIGDFADMASIIRGEKDTDFSYEHDLHVQETVLRAAGLPMKPKL